MWINETNNGKSNQKQSRIVFDTEFNLTFHRPKKMPAKTVSGINWKMGK